MDYFYNSINSLSNDETVDLIVKYKENNDSIILEKLILGNMNLIKLIYRNHYSNFSFIYQDIIQIGVTGLIKAINNFDINLNYKFSTYAYPTIQGTILHSLRSDYSISLIRYPRKYKDINSKLKIFEKDYINNYNKEPTVEIILDSLDITFEDYNAALNYSRSDVSLDYKIFNSDGYYVNRIDLIEDKKDNYNDMENNYILNELLDLLSDKERDIIYLFYIKELKQKEISNIMGISQPHVSRIITNGISKIRNKLPLLEYTTYN